MIQIRDVPEPVHRILKARAAISGSTLSSYCLAQLKRSAEQPTFAEMRERLEKLPRLGIHSVGAAEIIRQERDRP